MKKYYLILSIAVLFASCHVKITTDSNSKLPEYDEFTVDTTMYQTVNKNNVKPIDNQQNSTGTYTFSANVDDDLANPGQKVIFSFKAQSGKTLSLLTNANEDYLIYRFGKPDKIEFRYPEIVDNNSWENFTFEKYSTDNQRFSHIIFTNYDFKYTIYYNENINSGVAKCGVQVKNLNNGEITDIQANMTTIKGSLNDFKNYDKIN